MRLAKPHIDIGLFTNRRDEQLRFWGETVGLTFDQMLKLGHGRQQHRFAANGSIVKVNHARDPLPDFPPCGYRRLFIARAGATGPYDLPDPDGNGVSLVPPGHRGVVGIAVALAVNDLAATGRFSRDALRLEEAGHDTWRCGDSLLFLEAARDRIPASDNDGRGWRYITIQVKDCDREHARILQAGGTEGRAPVTLGTTARISFVRDPDGNWIEISERASLTGMAVA
jgi:lactoylglutathione lyase